MRSESPTRRPAAPRPLGDDAWRADPCAPGIAHFFGGSDGPDFDGSSACWLLLPCEGTRPATEDDRLCPDCDTWFWQHLPIQIASPTLVRGGRQATSRRSPTSRDRARDRAAS